MSEGRKYLSAREKAEILFQQKGICAKPGCGSEGPFDWDHSTPNAWKPGKPDQALCKACHKSKTAADVGKIAKVNRINGITTSKWNGDNRFKGRIRSNPTIPSPADAWGKWRKEKTR